jgi:hypothetical protein
MVRGRKAGATAVTLDQQIEKAQEKVIKTRQAYDIATDALQKLLDKRDAKRKDELWDATLKSEKSYEEILGFIRANASEQEE